MTSNLRDLKEAVSLRIVRFGEDRSTYRAPEYEEVFGPIKPLSEDELKEIRPQDFKSCHHPLVYKACGRGQRCPQWPPVVRHYD